MRICVVGAGAIGGLVGVKMALAGEDVTLVDVGEHLAAIRDKGLELRMADGTVHLAEDVHATDRFDEAGEQDLVFLALKTNVIASVAEPMRALYGPDTMVVPLQNGLPWWYFQRHGGEHDGRALRCADANGVIGANVEPERIIGCVVFPAGHIEAPGVVQHTEGNRFPVGELDGAGTERVAAVAETFTRAGFKSFVLDDIRAEIWLKLLGNMSFNPISALTHATMVDIYEHVESRDLASKMMHEAAEVAGKLGITMRVPIEKRIEGAAKVGRHKTSMLQDVEAGRRLELDALIGAVLEIGEMTGTPTPYTEAVYGLVTLLDRTMGEEQVRVRAEPLAG